MTKKESNKKIKITFTMVKTISKGWTSYEYKTSPKELSASDVESMINWILHKNQCVLTNINLSKPQVKL